MYCILQNLDSSDIDDDTLVLHTAVKTGDIHLVEHRLNSCECDINEVNRFFATPLHIAVDGNYVDIVRLLLIKGAAVDLPDRKCRTPLFIAAQKRYLQCLDLLLKFGANPDGDQGNMTTPIYNAAMEGESETCRKLIQYGADVCLPRLAIGGHTSTPIHVALIYGHFECFKLLIHRVVVQGIDKFEALALRPLYHDIIRANCDTRFAKLLYECGFDPSVRFGGIMAHELTQNPQINSSVFLKSVIGKPRTLLSLSRIAVIRHFSLHDPDLFDIPAVLKRYLKFEIL